MTSPTCPDGKVLTGGGFDWSFGGTDVWIWQSSPNSAGTAWVVRGNVNRGGSSSDITSFAICASASSAAPAATASSAATKDGTVATGRSND